MMDKWLKKVTPGEKGLTRPPVSLSVSAHKNEVRSTPREYVQDISKTDSRYHENEEEGEEDVDEDEVDGVIC
jgi:hypothetical protein